MADESNSTTGGIASAEQRLATLTGEIRKVVAEVNQHVAEHEAVIEAHKREVAAAKKLIASVFPGSDPKAAEAAAFVLTAPTKVQAVVRFLGRNWRYVVFAGCAYVIFRFVF